MLMSLVVRGRTDVLGGLPMFNLSTMCAEPEQMAQRTVAGLEDLPAALGLSWQQVEDISTGTALFVHLMECIHKERRQLQVQCQATLSDAASSAASFSSVDKTLELQQCHTARLHLLLQKEYAITAAAGGFVVGCLSLEQFTRAFALSWPYVLRIPLLGKSIAEYGNRQRQPGGAGGRSVPAACTPEGA